MSAPKPTSFTDIQGFVRRIVNQIGLNYTDSDSNNNVIDTIYRKITEIEFIEHFFDDIDLIKRLDKLKQYGTFETTSKHTYYKEIDIVPNQIDPVDGHDTISNDRKVTFWEYQLPSDFYYKIKFNFNSQLNTLQDMAGSMFNGAIPYTPEWIGAYDQQWVRAMSPSLQNSRVPPNFGNNLDSLMIRYGTMYRSLLEINPICLRYVPMTIDYILQDTTRKIKKSYEYYILHWLCATQNGIINRNYATEEKTQMFKYEKSKSYNELFTALEQGFF